MLSEDQIKLLRKAISSLPGEPAAGAKWILAIILEEDPPGMPPLVQQVKDAEPAEKTAEQRQIEDLQEALAATRERAERAEVKYVELKRNGG